MISPLTPRSKNPTCLTHLENPSDRSVGSAPGPYAGTSDFAWIAWRGLCITPRKVCPIQLFVFCDFLRWFGTNLEAGFVIYAEKILRRSLVCPSEFGNVHPMIPRRFLAASARGAARSRACGAAPAGWGGVRSLVSERHQLQSALGVESAIGHDYGLSLGTEGARLV